MIPFRTSSSRRPELFSLLALVLTACGGTQVRPPAPPPAWFQSPPKGPRALYFTGDATQAPEEGLARDLAVQKALHNLTVYVGAEVKSLASSVEMEKNGVGQQEVSLVVDVAGEELTIREATVKELIVQAGVAGGFDAYALVEWPRQQYEAVLASQRDRAGRALALYLEAEAATEQAELLRARDKLDESQELLGRSRAVVPLDHPQLRDTSVLKTAMAALDKRIREVSEERRRVCAVGVICSKDGSKTPCSSARLGILRQAVSKSGKRLATQLPSEGVLEGILASGQLSSDASIKSAGCIVAVQLTAELLEAGDPFTYVRYGARTVVFDTDSSRIVHSHEIPPSKMGHTSFDAAMNKGFDQAQRVVADEIAAALSKH